MAALSRVLAERLLAAMYCEARWYSRTARSRAADASLTEAKLTSVAGDAVVGTLLAGARVFVAGGAVPPPFAVVGRAVGFPPMAHPAPRSRVAPPACLPRSAGH